MKWYTSIAAIGTLSLICGGALAQRTRLQGSAAADAVPCPAADASAPDPTFVIRKPAFDALAHGDTAEGRRLLRCAVQADPKDLTALRQLVYLDLSAGDTRLALEDIDSLRAMGVSEPRFESQEGYILFNAKKYEAARQAFSRAAQGNDPEIRNDALRAMQVIADEFPMHVLEVAVDGQYLHRFDDGVVDAYARFFQRLGTRSPLRAYVGVRLLRDTASEVGPLPQIFADNALLTGVGLAFQPHEAHYFLSAEANTAYAFYAGAGGRAALLPDYRTVAGYYRLFRPGADSALHRVSFEANGSFGYYSRYGRDAIAYLQPQETYDLNKGTLRVAPFFQQSFAFDTTRQFYNNTAELIPGVQLSLERFRNAALRVEYVRGYYLPAASPSANPYGASYNDFRVRLTFDKQFFLHREQPAIPPAGAPH